MERRPDSCVHSRARHARVWVTRGQRRVWSCNVGGAYWFWYTSTPIHDRTVLHAWVILKTSPSDCSRAHARGPARAPASGAARTSRISELSLKLRWFWLWSVSRIAEFEFLKNLYLGKAAGSGWGEKYCSKYWRSPKLYLGVALTMDSLIYDSDQ